MIHKVERFREERVLEKFWEAEGKSKEDIEVGNAGSTAIALCIWAIVLHKRCCLIYCKSRLESKEPSV